MSVKQKILFELTGATEIKILYYGANLDSNIKLGEYWLSADLSQISIDDALNDMIKRIKTNKITTENYVEFLTNSFPGVRYSFNDTNSEIPSLELFKELNIKIGHITGLIYPFENLNEAIEYVATAVVYNSYDEIDFSEYSIIHSVTATDGIYKVRGVKKSVLDNKIAEVKDFLESENSENE